MCDLEYNFKTMSKKDMVNILNYLEDDVRRLEEENQKLEVQLGLEKSYKNLARAERDAAKNAMCEVISKSDSALLLGDINKLKDENKKLAAENKALKEKCSELFVMNRNLDGNNNYLQRRLKEAEEAAKNATDALNRLTDSTQHLRCYLVNRHMYMQNLNLSIPDDFMLEDAKYHFPFLNDKIIMVQSTCRHRQIKIICMYGGSYYYDFDTQTLKATEIGD